MICVDMNIAKAEMKQVCDIITEKFADNQEHTLDELATYAEQTNQIVIRDFHLFATACKSLHKNNKIKIKE